MCYKGEMSRLILSGKLYICALLLIMLIMVQAGCIAGPEPGSPTAAGNEPAYAGEIVDTMLKAMDSNDYTAFTHRFDDELKESLTENAFAGLHNLTSANAGTYLSKRYLSSARYDEYVEVLYDAEYSIDNVEMEVKIVFKEAGDDVYVSGFWLNSPAFYSEPSPRTLHKRMLNPEVCKSF